MKAVRILAFNTYREILRDKILYGFLIFAIFFIGLSLALGQLSYAEQIRITANFGTTALQLSSIFLAILLGAVLLPREIEKKTILTILVRPLARWQFLLGKVLGLFLMIAVVGGGLSGIVALVMFMAGGKDLHYLLPILYGTLLESLIMLSVTLLFSTFSRPILVGCMSFGIFLIGHWQSTLNELSKNESQQSLRTFKKVIEFIIPDLEVFNWKGLLIYQDPISYSTLGVATLYAIGWFFVLMFIASLIFERKDLG